MGGYFSFDRMITGGFVKAIYFIGFLLLTAAGIALIAWAGLKLNDAAISRSLGWRYVAIGAAAVVLGNIVWRVFCELWVVLFGIHSELVSVRHALNLNQAGPRIVDEPVATEVTPDRGETVRPREVVVREKDRSSPRSAGVLGLS